jgi:transglutaminase-like putative cysteine protease
MRVSITHRTRLDYSTEVTQGVMDTRLGPHSDAHQRWERFALEVSSGGAVRRYSDAFDNVAHLLTLARPHRSVEVLATGTVETLLADPFALPAVPAPPLRAAERFDYLQESSLVALVPAVAAMAEPYRPEQPMETLEAVRQLMGLVYRGFAYQKDATTVTTTVPELLLQRSGVCQDFAHVLIALCRSIGIPARYVSGYIVASDSRVQAQHQESARSQSGGSSSRAEGQSQRQGQSRGLSGAAVTADEPPLGPTRGTGASHAWVEAYTPTHGWRGFDPTNNVLANESHVKMAIGRDYGDVPPSRGTFRGVADERLTVEVVCRPIGLGG